MARARRSFKAFSPFSVTAIKRWYRLAASTPVSSEYETVVEVYGGSSIAATGVRKPAAATAPNGLPVATWDETDVWVMPLDTSGTGNNSTTKFGFFLWFKPASVSGIQRILTIAIAAGGASAEKLQLYANNATLRCECYITNANGRFGTSGNVLAAGVWSCIYLQYDSSRGGDACLRIYHNGNNESLTFANLGAGGTLGAFQATTGNAFIGAATNTDTPTQAILNGGQTGPNYWSMDENLSTDEEARLRAFEVPD